MLTGIGSERGARRILFAALLLTIVVRLAWFFHSKGHVLIWDEGTYDGIAWRMLHNGLTMTNGDGRYTAFVGPTYPAFLMLVYAVFGHSMAAAYLVQIALSVLNTYLIYRIGEMITASRIVSALAVLALAVYPPHVLFTTLLMTECIFTLLVAGTLYLLLRGLRGEGEIFFALAGLVGGLASLCRGSFLLMPLLFSIVIGLACKRTKKLLVGITLFLAVFLMTLSPWITRNYRVFQAFVPGSTEAGFVLWCGNYGDYGVGSISPVDNPPRYVLDYVATKPSETQLNTFFQREAFKNMKANPVHCLALSVRRLAQFWFNVGYKDRPSKASLAIMAVHLALMCLAIYSFRSVKNRVGLAIIISLLVSITLVHMLTIGLVRYALPFVPYLTILAVCGLFKLIPSLEDCLNVEQSTVVETSP